MKFDDDESESTVAEVVNGESVSSDAPKAEKIGFADWLIGAALGGIIFVLLSLWAFPTLSPNVWDDAAIAAGIRPAAALCPGLWYSLVGFLFKSCGIESALAILPLLGRIAAGMLVVFAYMLFRECLSLTIRMRLQRSPMRVLVARLAAALGAFLFGCSDPIWHMGQAFTPDALLLICTVLALYFFFAFLQRSSLACAYVSMTLLGVLSAETPLGFAFMFICWGVYVLAARNVLTLDMPLFNPFIEQVTKWHLTFLFVFGFVGTVFLNCFTFRGMEGLAALGWTVGDLPQQYALRLWHLVTHGGSLMGWVLSVAIIILPMAVTAGLMPSAADEEQFLPYRTGVIYILAGLLAFAQFTSIDALWYWTWIKSPVMVTSPLLLDVFMLFNAFTLVAAIATLGVDVYCRNHRRLALQRFADMRQEIDEAELPASGRFMKFMRRIGIVIVPLAILAGSVPGRRLSTVREMLSIIRDYVEETVREAVDVKWIFTDGAYDSIVELVSARNGGKLRAMSMMADNSPRNSYIRSNGVEDSEDVLAMMSGAAAILRTWVRDKPARLAEVAVQLGFELWKRDGKSVPECSGVLSRPAGMKPEEATRGIEEARKLSTRVLSLYAKGGPARAAGTHINSLFLFCQWRLARLARMRAERADLAGKAELAIEDVRLSDELDKNNASLKVILEAMERQRRLALRQTTPREGLQLALARADYELARRYAEPILKSDPEDPDANFGVGMSYMTQNQFARAEEYLRRCLVRRPTEPAIYNNLAMLQLKMGRYEAAEKNAKKALELLPDAAEVRDTVMQIRKAAEKAKNRAIEAKEDKKEKDK